MINPDMPTQELRLYMGELTPDEIRVARAAIRWANSAQEIKYVTKIDTKEIRDGKYDCSYETIKNLCDAYDEAQREIEALKEITTLHCEKRGDMLIEQDARIAALEEVASYLLPKAEYSNDGHCPECDVSHKEHLSGCHFIKIRAVLEGK